MCLPLHICHVSDMFHINTPTCSLWILSPSTSFCPPAWGAELSAGSSTLNSLPPDIRHIGFLPLFKSRLKTHLFNSATQLFLITLSSCFLRRHYYIFYLLYFCFVKSPLVARKALIKKHKDRFSGILNFLKETKECCPFRGFIF